MSKEIDDFLDLTPLEGDIQEAKTLVKSEKASENLDADFEYIRGNLYQVIENGSNALAELLEVANASQNPRAFEVVATLVRTLSDANIALMDVTKKKQDIQKDDEEAGVPKGGTLNQNLFVGSTGDLLAMINKAKKEG